ncbi:MAG: GAK system CofD-like protein [Desulfovibrionales bacterium]
MNKEEKLVTGFPGQEVIIKDQETSFLTRCSNSLFCDGRRIAELRRNPEKGPKLLFFSGGTALRRSARELTKYTHNSIHIVTPFDSGGSSAVLRRAFHMPAVGDIRNRLLALADRGCPENAGMIALLSHRFPKDVPQAILRYELFSMASGEHPMVKVLSEALQEMVCSHLRTFLQSMPPAFSLSGASIGNLLLTAGYLRHNRTFDPILERFSRVAKVRGMVLPVINKDYHLAAELADGRTILGQHRMTAKEAPRLDSPLTRIWMTSGMDDPAPVDASISQRIKELIMEADCICFPVGSFFTSLLSNLLPSGVGRAVAANPCPKVFVPNSAPDPELKGIDIQSQTDLLLQTLAADQPGTAGEDLLDHVLVDRMRGNYPGIIRESWFSERSIRLIDTPLVDSKDSTLIHEKKLVPLLLSICLTGNS